MNTKEVIADLQRRFPNEPEYHQAVEEVLSSIEDVYNEHPEFERYNLIERLCIPDWKSRCILPPVGGKKLTPSSK